MTQATDDPKQAGQRYRFQRLTLPLVLRDLRFGKDDPGPGDRVPDFDLPTLGGGRFRSMDLAETGPALLVFGSSTCPVTDNAAPGLGELHRRFGDRVRFVMVGVREAHPGQAFPQPTTLDEKRAHAARLRDIYGFEFEIAIELADDLPVVGAPYTRARGWMGSSDCRPLWVRLVVLRLPAAISISVIDRYGFWPIEYTFCRKKRSRIVELPTTTTS